MCMCVLSCSVAQLCPALSDSMDYNPVLQASLSMGSSSKHTGVVCHFLLQEIFPTQGSNLHLQGFLHWEVDSLLLSHLGSLL